MAVFLSARELDKIKRLATGSPIVRNFHKKKSALAEKSEARSQKWPNTLENLRAQKLRARRQRLDEIEHQQKKVDEEEAKLRKEERQQRIKRAQIILYEAQDHVKKYSSAKVLAEAMKEQKKQIALKRERTCKEAERESLYHKMQIEGARRMKEREDREMKRRMELAKMFAAEQKLQLAQMQAREAARKEEENEIGLRALALAKKVKEEAEEAQRQRAKNIKRKNLEKIHENERLVAHKQELRQREIEQEKRIEEFSRKKEEDIEKRKKAEAETFRRKQEARQKIIDEQTRRLEAMKKREKELTEKQNNDAEKKRLEEQKMRDERRQKLMEDIDRSRTQQIKYKQIRREAELKHDQTLVTCTRARVKELVEIEKAERMATVKKNKEHADFLLKQAKEKENARKDELRQLLAEDRRRIENLENEERQLSAYVEELRRNMRGEGLDLRPLERMAEKNKVMKAADKQSSSEWTGPL